MLMMQDMYGLRPLQLAGREETQAFLQQLEQTARLTTPQLAHSTAVVASNLLNSQSLQDGIIQAESDKNEQNRQRETENQVDEAQRQLLYEVKMAEEKRRREVEELNRQAEERRQMEADRERLREVKEAEKREEGAERKRIQEAKEANKREKEAERQRLREAKEANKREKEAERQRRREAKEAEKREKEAERQRWREAKEARKQRELGTPAGANGEHSPYHPQPSLKPVSHRSCAGGSETCNARR